jgi:undecaprenyl-diphosphatase
MDMLHVIWLALLQGLTEFLPISSSAHLILLPQLMDWSDQGLAFDVSVHLGTLCAVLLYFRRDLVVMTRDWLGSLWHRKLTPDARLAWAVIWGTVPAGLAGFLFADSIEQHLRSPLVIAATTILFGALLWWADTHRKESRDEHGLGWRDIAIVGFAQALALIPGTSRSGITITAGLMVGLGREAAARYSFLLSIPIILAAGGLEAKKLAQNQLPVDWWALGVGTAVAGISAYLVIHYFLKLISRITMLPFVLYRLALGVILLFLFV